MTIVYVFLVNKIPPLFLMCIIIIQETREEKQILLGVTGARIGIEYV